VEGGGGDGEGSRSTNLWAEQVEKVATARTVAGGGANTEGANVSLMVHSIVQTTQTYF
jgi:hypothetical protein